MTNSEKIQILEDNITSLIKNSRTIDENYIFNFAKQQAKEMQIEISLGEVRTIISNLLILNKNAGTIKQISSNIFINENPEKQIDLN